MNDQPVWSRPSGPAFRWHAAQASAPPRLWALGGLMAATALIYWPGSLALAGLWTDTRERTYTYGFPVLLTSIWLLWRRRASLESRALRPEPLALGAVLLASAGWLIAWRASIQDAQLLALPVLLLAAALAAFGWSLTRAIAFPVCFIGFALPVWSDLVEPLRWLSIRAVAVLIGLTGLPAHVRADLILLPGGTLEIGGGCSGLHYLTVGLAFAALYGEVLEQPLRRRLSWLAIMGVIALLANWVRIFTIAAAACATDMRTSLIGYHYWFGWLVFAAGLGLFLWIADRGSRDGAGAPQREPVAGGRAPEGARVNWRAWSEALLCMAALPLLVYAHDAYHDTRAGSIAIQWPAAPRGWTGPLAGGAARWRPIFHQASVAGMRRYVEGSGTPVDLFEVAYVDQRQGAELVAYDNSVLGDPDDIRPRSERLVQAAAGAWREDILRARDGGTTYVIWSRYRVGRVTFVRPILSQLDYGVASLATPPLSSLTALRIACHPGCAAARSSLAAAAEELLPGLRLLPRRRSPAPARSAP